VRPTARRTRSRPAEPSGARRPPARMATSRCGHAPVLGGGCVRRNANMLAPPGRATARRSTNSSAPGLQHNTNARPWARQEISAGRLRERPRLRDLATGCLSHSGLNRPRTATFPCSDLRCRPAQTGTDIGTSAPAAPGGRRRRAGLRASRVGAAGFGTVPENRLTARRTGHETAFAPATPRRRIPHGTASRNHGTRKARGPPLRKGASARGDSRPLRSNAVRIAVAARYATKPMHTQPSKRHMGQWDSARVHR
jgi:hypothetical protein